MEGGENELGFAVKQAGSGRGFGRGAEGFNGHGGSRIRRTIVALGEK